MEIIHIIYHKLKYIHNCKDSLTKIDDYINILIMKLSIILLYATIILMAEAWWDKGHMLVSQIAWNHLTDTNNTNARDKFNGLILALNPFTDGKTQTFTEAAVWADDIKNYNVK
jgi:hypothetical protein